MFLHSGCWQCELFPALCGSRNCSTGSFLVVFHLFWDSFFIYSWRFKGNLPTDLRSLSAVFFPPILHPANSGCLGLSSLSSVSLIQWNTRLSLSNIGTGEGLTSFVSLFLGIISLCCLLSSVWKPFLFDFIYFIWFLRNVKQKVKSNHGQKWKSWHGTIRNKSFTSLHLPPIQGKLVYSSSYPFKACRCAWAHTCRLSFEFCFEMGMCVQLVFIICCF